MARKEIRLDINHHTEALRKLAAVDAEYLRSLAAQLRSLPKLPSPEDILIAEHLNILGDFPATDGEIMPIEEADVADYDWLEIAAILRRIADRKQASLRRKKQP
jgi:hypothetical protein